MKKLMAIPLALFFAFPVIAQTRSYDDEVPLLEEEYIEVDEVEPSRQEMEAVEEQRMEDLDESMSDDGINYNDRTRTNRARHAINTSGDASDDR